MRYMLLIEFINPIDGKWARARSQTKIPCFKPKFRIDDYFCMIISNNLKS